MSIAILDGIFLTSLGFNAASLNSVYNGGVAFTSTDPLLGSVFISVLWACLRSSQNHPLIHGFFCSVGGTLLSIGGAISHILKRDIYVQASAYHDTHWQWAVFLNGFTVIVLLYRIANYSHRKMVLFTIMSLVFLKGLIPVPQATLCSDLPYFSASGVGLPQLPVTRTSQYIAMSDGIEVAVDIYLPHDIGDKALPTFLHLTRYHRAEQRSLLTKFLFLFGAPPTPDAHFAMRSLHYINAFVPSGYAFVSVDVRGTGASFGSRPVDLSTREVEDYIELASWVKQQSFCNGRVGTGGISYDGIAGALMASHGNIDAAVLLFSPGDIFEDIGFVGGIPTIGFVDLYGKFTTASERNVPVNDVDNELPASFNFISAHALKGVAPVVGQEEKLAHAVAQHQDNFDMLKAARDPNIIAKDSVVVSVEGNDYTVGSLGIGAETIQGLEKHGVAVYSVAGYYDSASVRSAARLHNHLITHGKSKQSKLTIGPWTHGARACWTPNAEGTLPQYPLFEDVKRFFDCKLNDECGDLEHEPVLHYFNSGPDEWKAGEDVWPPRGLQVKSIGLAACNVSGHDVNSEIDHNMLSPLTYSIKTNATSGLVSRWNLVYHLMKMSVTYPELSSQHDLSLVFSKHLVEPLSITGSVHVGLSLALLGGDDAAIFAYLEEVDSVKNVVYYITEGVIRVSHRVLSSDSRTHVGAFDNVVRSYARADMSPLPLGQHSLIEFTLEPIAYTVPADRILRLRLAGADADNFYLDNIKGIAPQWDIDIINSQIQIPVS